MSSKESNSQEIAIGIAPSDLANKKNPSLTLPGDFLKLTAKLVEVGQGLELEYERTVDEADFPTVFPRPVFIGVHQPTGKIDVNSTDPEIVQLSTKRVKAAMDLAHLISANYFTIHLQTVDRHWTDDVSRQSHAKDSIEKLGELFDYHDENDYKYPLLVENLEYPKYPASPEEIQAVSDILQANYPGISGLVIDTGHLWRSRSLYHEAHDGEPLNTPGAENQSFLDYLSVTLDLVGDNIGAFHVTGVDGIRTHMMPDLSEAYHLDSNKDKNNRFLFSEIGRTVLKFISDEPRLIPVVNEAFEHPYTEVIDNNDAIKQLVD